MRSICCLVLIAVLMSAAQMTESVIAEMPSIPVCNILIFYTTCLGSVISKNPSHIMCTLMTTSFTTLSLLRILLYLLKPLLSLTFSLLQHIQNSLARVITKYQCITSTLKITKLCLLTYKTFNNLYNNL